jgi:copper homeostasis protein
MPQNSPYTLEICVEAPSALAACCDDADRIELCSGLDVGGLTPSIGLMELAALSGVETHVLIRERSGNFAMTATDITAAVASIRVVREMGLHGVVIGAAQDGVLDRAALDAMVHAADGLDVTLHRVIDVLDDPIAVMEVAVEYGITRILTSGAASSAANGIAGLTRLHEAADGRIEIMAGAGINSNNIGSLMAQTNITSFHASCSTKAALEQRYVDFGFGKSTRCFDEKEFTRMLAELRK